MEEVASGAAECPTVERFTSSADDESRVLSDALPLDFPNMLLSLPLYLMQVQIA
jgi:hypothetical protein